MAATRRFEGNRVSHDGEMQQHFEMDASIDSKYNKA